MMSLAPMNSATGPGELTGSVELGVARFLGQFPSTSRAEALHLALQALSARMEPDKVLGCELAWQVHLHSYWSQSASGQRNGLRERGGLLSLLLGIPGPEPRLGDDVQNGGHRGQLAPINRVEPVATPGTLGVPSRHEYPERLEDPAGLRGLLARVADQDLGALPDELETLEQVGMEREGN
jgi:hypothetical protein